MHAAAPLVKYSDRNVWRKRAGGVDARKTPEFLGMGQSGDDWKIMDKNQLKFALEASDFVTASTHFQRGKSWREMSG